MSLRNRLLALLQPWRDTLVEQLAAELVRRCRANIQHSVCQKAASMSQNMARGYLRAYASRCVAAEMDTMVAPINGRCEFSPKVAAAAVAQLITALLQDSATLTLPPRVRAAA
jgi:hypothetical protein